MTTPRVTRRLAGAALAAATLGTAAGCRLDVANPNAATQGAVLTSAAGLTAVAVGLQGRIGNAVGPAVTIPGLVSGEIGNTDASLSTQREFQRYPVASANAPAIDPTNPDLLNFWSTQYQVVKSANDLLSGSAAVGLQAGTKSGMSALAKAAKAWAFGTLIEAWTQVPLDPTQAQPTFSDRATTLTQVQALLASARADLTTTPVSSEFTGLLQASIDLPNTIRAWQARYALAAGAYDAAIGFANDVPAAATSAVTFSSVAQNPVWGAVTSNGYFAAIATFRTGAEAGDTRVNRFVGTTVTTPFGGAQVVPIVLYANQAAPYPLFTQDELSLIRAEAYARTNRLSQALPELNAVRARAGLAAKDASALPDQASVLAEVYRQRQYALFLTGTRWADERRFGRLADARAAALPYPAQQRAANPNTPADP